MESYIETKRVQIKTFRFDMSESSGVSSKYIDKTVNEFLDRFDHPGDILKIETTHYGKYMMFYTIVYIETTRVYTSK